MARTIQSHDVMTLETRPFDPAEYLDTDEAQAAYLTEALDTADPALISDSLAVIARAITASESLGAVDPAICEKLNPELGAVLDAVRALGLRLEATVAVQLEPAET
jgi:probable addiction module antidote protein